MGAKGAALMLPFANTAAMQMHLDEISCNVAAKAHGVVLMDRAGWHSTDQLKVPKNLTIILLPSRSPELNPVENIWQYLRQNWLSNRVFEDYDAIIEAGCQAWNKLIDQPETIMSIGTRDWAFSDFRSIISAVGISPRCRRIVSVKRLWSDSVEIFAWRSSDRDRHRPSHDRVWFDIRHHWLGDDIHGWGLSVVV